MVQLVNYSAGARAKLAEAKGRQLISRSFELINQHLYSVEERIRDQARAFDPAVEGYISYACESKGKRMRPALALLMGAAAGEIHTSHIDLATIVELIHLATLVHDDIIDGAELRRSQLTANAKWGNSISVLLGDCLFAHALKLSTSFHNSEISRRIADAAVNVCSGEILQTQRRFDLKLSIPDYYHIIEMKTAALFGVASELGAFLSDANPEVITGAKVFGLRLGTAYQIYDDILDIAGVEEKTGKTLGTDLAKGKLTLPVLLLLQQSSRNDQEDLQNLILAADADSMNKIVGQVWERGGIAAAATAGRKLVREGRDALASLDRSRYRSALEDIADYLDSLLASSVK
jgi:octaprenyl-diphosphate synthase